MCRTRRAAIGLAVLALLWPTAARSQGTLASHRHDLGDAVSFGGEITALLAPPDDHAYFNYTDYDRDGLRLALVRFFAEWRLVDRLSIVGEIRTENADRLSAPAFYARWQPAANVPVTVQAGRIPPVIGAYVRRAYGRDNLVFGQPLAYQYLTALRSDALPASTGDLLAMRGRGWQPIYPLGSQELRPGLPIVSSVDWDTGAEVAWEPGALSLAAAVTRGSPADPVVRETNGGLMWSGRAAIRLPAGVTLGVSGARGDWLSRSAREGLGLEEHESTQSLIGADVEFGSGPWILRGEWMHSTFRLPLINARQPLALGATTGFVESRYRMHPRWQLGLRAERLTFSRIDDPFHDGARVTWDAPVGRVEAAIGLRATRQLELRLGWQQNWRDGGRVRSRGVPVAGAYYWF